MQNSNNCGCCEGHAQETPLQVYNRPSLSAISYRVGEHAQFKESLLNRLSTSRLKALSDLTTRDNRDFSLALLDAWAMVSDVLTFYQERIANESYLGTATETFSIREMARLIGYELRPGVAANTFLAFNLDENSLAAGQLVAAGRTRAKFPLPTITLDVGIKVQSIPEKDEAPQLFETVEAIKAHPEWNVIRPQQFQIQKNIANRNLIVIEGVGNNLKVGDILLIAGAKKELKKVLKVTLDQANQTTTLYLNTTAGVSDFVAPDRQDLVPNAQVDAFANYEELNGTIAQEILNKTWIASDLATLLETKVWSAFDLVEHITTEVDGQGVGDNEAKVFVFRQKAPPFGYNAPEKVSYLKAENGDSIPHWNEWSLSGLDYGRQIYLDNVYEQILSDSYIAIQPSGAAIEQAKVCPIVAVNVGSRTDYGMSAKTTILSLSSPPETAWWKLNPAEGTNFRTRAASNLAQLSVIRPMLIHFQSEPLVLSREPIEGIISGKIIALSKLYLGLTKDQHIILSGERADLRGAFVSEVQQLQEVYIYEGRTVIELTQELSHDYLRQSVTINANVAAATQGETVHELLGSGDAGKVFQQFVLKQPPLTYTSAATASGTLSSLQVRVNDILWQEVPSLYGQQPDAQVYVTRQDDEGQTTVLFGDGIQGARLPSGQQNIKASYRKGMGTGGLLKANQLSQLMTRPLGVKSVNNPLASSGAQDRESLSDARRNANLTILTLDRIVSLQDYEDFARAFTGISKALATWARLETSTQAVAKRAWIGHRRKVVITVAGYQGAKVPAGSDLYTNLLDTIKKDGIPGVSVEIKSFQHTFFRLAAKIMIDDKFIAEKVLTEIKMTLREHFSFEARQFGQPVVRSEVYAVIHKVSGVVAVDIDALYLMQGKDTVIDLNDPLVARVPRPGDTDTAAAELLTLDSAPIELTVLS